MVRHLEHRDRRTAGQLRAHRGLVRSRDVAGEQEPLAARLQQDDDAVAVGVAGDAGRAEHLGRQRPEAQRGAAPDLLDDRAGAREGGGERALDRPGDVGAPRAQVVDDVDEAADVVGVHVRGDDGVEAL